MLILSLKTNKHLFRDILDNVESDVWVLWPRHFILQICVCVCVTIMYMVAQSCPTICNPMDCSPSGSSVHGDSPGKNTGVGCHALLQEIISTQGSNPGLPHCRRILYHLSHQGNPRTLERVAYPFFRGLPDQGIELGSPALQTDSLPAALPGKPNYTF